MSARRCMCLSRRARRFLRREVVAWFRKSRDATFKTHAYDTIENADSLYNTMSGVWRVCSFHGFFFVLVRG